MIVLLFFALCFSGAVEAQVFGTSYFPAYEHGNPAVLNLRPLGIFSVAGSQTDTEKVQTIDFDDQDLGYSFEGTVTSTGEYSEYNAFRGGKGGKGITTEMSLIQAAGERNDSHMTVAGVEETTDSAKADLTAGTYAIALGDHFGLSLGFAKYSFDNSLNRPYEAGNGFGNATTFVFETIRDISLLNIKVGTRFGIIGNFGLGLYVGSSSVSGTDTFKIYGDGAEVPMQIVTQNLEAR